ncbi:GNAT family N-acetyltransferase [Guggenheimella bovis]
MEVTTIHPDLFERLYQFDLENRAHFDLLGVRRPDSYFEKKNFERAQHMLMEEHMAQENFHYIVLHEDRVIARISFVDFVPEPFYQANIFGRIGEVDTRLFIEENGFYDVLKRVKEDAVIHKAITRARADSPDSQEVLLRAGFREVGLLKKEVQVAGEWIDMIYYEALLEEIE